MAWLLERRYPERWRRRDTVQVDSAPPAGPSEVVLRGEGNGNSEPARFGRRTSWAECPASDRWKGDQSTIVDQPDYFLRPPDLSARQQRALGVSAVMALGIGTAVFILASLQGRIDWRWCGPLVPLVAAGVVVGWGYRVVTAGVAGANLGVAVVVVIGGPLVLGLLTVAVVLAALIIYSR